MSNGVSAIVSGAFIAIMSAGGVGGFNLYTDVQLLKEHTKAIERTVMDREETTQRFTSMMAQMDKTLAVQTEAVNTLKEAVKRIEQNSFISYKDNTYDRRN